MRAIIHTGGSGIEHLQQTEMPERFPGTGEVKIRLKAAGLNHRDLFLMAARNEHDVPLILGSDGAGMIEAVGADVDELLIGTEVIINPCLDWVKTDEVPSVPNILGGPTSGTLAEYVIVPQANVVRKPAYLSWEEAGGLSLAALTAYRALFTKGHVQPGNHVLIPGISGGVATFAALMASAIGAHVTATSRNGAKRAQAQQLPIDRVLDSHGDWVQEMGSHTIDLILDSIGPAIFSQYFEVIKPNGTIVVFGASSGDEITIPMRSLFFPQINIVGTSMGSHAEFAAMIALLEQHRIRPVIDHVYTLSDIGVAFQRMQQSEQFGNIVIRIDENN
ncbi:quinone oxidoreductase family protein [Paenibacillus wenxiniae]|uniref:Zinc-binding alcohol dehydrogenase family protein n=1 Tax=Paenibacillus wenxiniae TaxID=1636843 RepID=A0ABW4RHU6_9BACL